MTFSIAKRFFSPLKAQFVLAKMIAEGQAAQGVVRKHYDGKRTFWIVTVQATA